MKALVVCYSRTGNTRELAQSIARGLGADLDLILARERRDGLFGYLRCGYEAKLERLASITQPTRHVEDYDLVVVGSPTWSGSMASPVRTYLTRHAQRIQSAAFFATCAVSGGDRAVLQMGALARVDPIATLVVHEADLRSGRAKSSVDIFVHHIVHGSWQAA